MEQSPSWKLLGSQVVNFILWNILWNQEVHYLIQKSLYGEQDGSVPCCPNLFISSCIVVFFSHIRLGILCIRCTRFPRQSPYVPRAPPVSSFSIQRYYFKTEPWVVKFTPKFSMVPGEQTYEMQINWGEIVMNRESVFVYQERVPLDCCSCFCYYYHHNFCAFSIKPSYHKL